MNAPTTFALRAGSLLGALRPRPWGPRLKLMASAAFGQLLALALAPWLARLYAPEVFGEFVLFTTLFNLLNIGLALRLEQAIPYCRDAAQTRATASLALLSCGSLAGLLLGITWLAGWLGVVQQVAVISLAIVSAAGSVISRLALQMLARWRRIDRMAGAQLLRPPGLGLLQVLGGVVQSSVGMLAAMHALTHSICALALASRTPGLAGRGKRAGWPALRAAAGQQRHFVFYNLPQNLVFVLSDALLPLLLLHTHGAAAAGLYWFAARFTTAPMQVFVDSLRGLMSAELKRRANRSQPLHGWVLRRALAMAAPFAAAALLLALTGGPIFSACFGPAWTEAAPLAACQFAYAAVNAAGAPLIAALPIVQRQPWHLASELAALVLKAIACWATAAAGLQASVASALGISMLASLGLYALVSRALRIRDSSQEAS